MNSKNQTLSVTLLVLNDAANLKACLDSVKTFADEVIVAVDSDTTDNSEAIAEKYTTKVFRVPHQDNFHLNKIKANEKATKDWVLQLDSDEIVTPELAAEISRVLSGSYFGYDSWISPLKKITGRRAQPLVEPAAAYFLPRKNFFLGRYLKHTGQYPDPVIRFYKRGKAHLPGHDVHEQMVVAGAIGWLKGELDHRATPNFARYLLRENRYSSLHTQELFGQGLKITPWHTLYYLFVKPTETFFLLYFRYRGFLDGFPGFVFSLYSGLHHAFSYMKLWELYRLRQK